VSKSRKNIVGTGLLNCVTGMAELFFFKHEEVGVLLVVIGLGGLVYAMFKKDAPAK